MLVNGFDIEQLKPTYQLLLGVPGKSNAFSICKKLGLDEAILKKAKSFLNDNQVHIEELLKNIYDDKLWIEKEKEEIQKKSNQITLLQKSLEQKNEELASKRNSYIDKAKQEARQILLAAKQEASSYIAQMNTIYENASSSSIKELNQLRNQINASLKETTCTENSTISSSCIKKEDLKIGSKVFIPHLKQEGIILNLSNKSEQVQVQVGNIKLMLPISSIGKIFKATTSSLHGSSTYHTTKTKSATTEINVIGYHVEEAIFTIDKYLDDCVLAKLQTIRIVHGKGTR